MSNLQCDSIKHLKKGDNKKSKRSTSNCRSKSSYFDFKVNKIHISQI